MSPSEITGAVVGSVLGVTWLLVCVWKHNKDARNATERKEERARERREERASERREERETEES